MPDLHQPSPGRPAGTPTNRELKEHVLRALPQCSRSMAKSAAGVAWSRWTASGQSSRVNLYQVAVDEAVRRLRACGIRVPALPWWAYRGPDPTATTALRNLGGER